MGTAGRHSQELGPRAGDCATGHTPCAPIPPPGSSGIGTTRNPLAAKRSRRDRDDPAGG
ncbi:hypothetical protein PJP10_17505 [Mycobacterium kansasii]